MKPRFAAPLYTALGLIGIFTLSTLNGFLVVKNYPSLFNIPIALLTTISSFFWLSCIGLSNLVGLSTLIDTQPYSTSLVLFTLCTIALWTMVAFISGYIYEKVNSRFNFVRIFVAIIPAALLLLYGLVQLVPN
jgi:hypothetical protein